MRPVTSGFSDQNCWASPTQCVVSVLEHLFTSLSKCSNIIKHFLFKYLIFNGNATE